MRDKIWKQNHECQNIVDKIENNLSPLYVGQLLIDLDCCRSRERLNEAYPLDYWDKVKEGNIVVSEVCGDPLMLGESDMNVFENIFNDQF